MLFNSYIFILFFLPVSLLVYYGLNHWGRQTEAKVFLTGMSLWFYGYFDIAYLLILVASIGINYAISKIVGDETIGVGRRKTVLTVGLLLNIAVIFYFKYFNFFMENVSWFLGVDFVAQNILMPLGISFFTFQQVSYLVDSYRGETKDYCLVDYALFVSFFPQLIAGPIVFHEEMIPQFNDTSKKKIDQDKLARGIWIFAIGLFKKVILADTLGRGADFGFGNVAGLSGADAWAILLCYTFQLYFDFSGYCDMAIGIANMFNMELPLNFNSPYKSVSITEFWKRWHITLGRFLTKYVYFPLGGSRKGFARTILNIAVVYLVSGIWHGAAWTYIVWGVMHGIASVVEKLCWPILEKIPKVLRWAGTMLFFIITLIPFRSASLSDAWVLFTKLGTGWGSGWQEELLAAFDVIEFTYIVEHVDVLLSFVNNHHYIYMIIILVSAMIIAFIPRNCHEKEFKPTVGRAFGSVVLLVWSIISFSGISTFLYFNF